VPRAILAQGGDRWQTAKSLPPRGSILRSCDWRDKEKHLSGWEGEFLDTNRLESEGGRGAVRKFLKVLYRYSTLKQTGKWGEIVLERGFTHGVGVLSERLRVCLYAQERRGILSVMGSGRVGRAFEEGNHHKFGSLSTGTGN